MAEVKIPLTIIKIHALVFVPHVAVDSLPSGLRSTIPHSRRLRLICIHAMSSRAHVGREFQTIAEVCFDSECNVCLVFVEQSVAINSSKICSPRDDLLGQ